MSSSSNTLTIRNCANTGTITGSGVQTGGIAGNLEGTSVIESCYNSGSIVGFNNYAGILGRGVGAAVKNSYTSGSIITYEGSTNVGYAIIGSSKSGGNCTVENSYALEGSGDALNYAKGVTADAASAYKSQADMQSGNLRCASWQCIPVQRGRVSDPDLGSSCSGSTFREGSVLSEPGICSS